MGEEITNRASQIVTEYQCDQYEKHQEVADMSTSFRNEKWSLQKIILQKY